MFWISNNSRYIRIAVLLLLLVSLFGPWAFDLINVPAEYSCDKPFIRLEGDYCGYPIPGFQAFFILTGGLFNIVAGWTQGDFLGRGRELIAVFLGLIFFLPFFNALLAIWKKDSRRWQSINLFLWGSACVPLVHYIFVLSQSKKQLLHVWGLWIYIVLAVSMLIVEFPIVRAGIATGGNLSSSHPV